MSSPSLLAIAREHSPAVLEATVTKILMEADSICGGGNTPEALTLMASMLIDRWGGRSINALMMAIRDGLNSGKVFGKLTYPLIGEWLLEHEEAFEAGSYAQHLGTK